MKEIWKPVPQFEGIYSVSNLGRVRSEARLDSLGRRNQGRIMRPRLNRYGYLHLDLRKDGKRYNLLVHKLVMLAFKGECPEDCEVNHINEDKTDNRADNLEYVTHLQNIRHGTGIARQAETTKKPVIATLPSGEEVRYPSARDAGRLLGVNSDVITHSINQKHRKTAYGMKWRYA